MSDEPGPRIVSVSEEARVTPIEPFFDLVFVFAVTQVTALMADDLTVHGLIRGLLVLALLWWSWVGYAWLGNVVQADEGLGRSAMFGGVALNPTGPRGLPVPHPAARVRVAGRRRGDVARLIPAAAQVPALVALAMVAAVLASLIVYESTTHSEFRERVRHEDVR